ncbi:MAG TPA: hypothetical protein VNO24_23475 [Blastocatellia bacterium]|nr:hypothetical protein [Blastocatellia bacterium]
MGRLIVIKEDAPEKPPVLTSSESQSFDLQDGLLIAGILSLEAAAIVIWWPSALILAGLFALGFVFLMERAKKKK